MAGSGPQQASPPHAESVNVSQPDELPNLERENHVDNPREGSSRMIHVGKSGYRRKSHLVQEHADEQDLQHEIDDLKRNFVEHNEIISLQILIPPPTMKKRTVTGTLQKLLPVNPTPMKRSILTKEGEKVRLEGEWELKT